MDNKAQQQLFNYIGISMRACSICKELKIPTTEPSWKTYCRACYAKSKSPDSGAALATPVAGRTMGSPRSPVSDIKMMTKQINRQITPPEPVIGGRTCVDCGQPKIAPQDPTWKVRCMDCWRLNKGGKPAAKRVPTQQNNGDDSDGYISPSE